MKVLNEKQIQYGFDYFHRDEESPRSVVEVSEYNGDTSLTINCTQLGDIFTPQFDTAKKKKRVLSEWRFFIREYHCIYRAELRNESSSRVIRCHLSAGKPQKAKY